VTRERVWSYLGGSDLEYVETVQRILGLESRSETIRFLIRLCRLIIPRANIISRIVTEVLNEENISGNAPSTIRGTPRSRVRGV